jgi:hypothetical protein
LTRIYKFDFYKKILYNIYRKLRKERKEMASRAKHAQRSKRSYHSNHIPVGMFVAHAQKVADAQFIRRMVKASAVAAEAVETE